jgi:RNA polymerase sigma-70 factor (ECF subfamily)
MGKGRMYAMQKLYEQTLVVRSQIGDDLAFEELLSCYGPHLFRFVSQMLQASPEVEDITQEVWLSIFKGLPSLRDPSKFRSWAFRIARDRIYREYRRRKIPAQATEPELAALAENSDAETTLDQEELLRGLDAISPEHREALVLCFWEDMSYEEISRVTGLSLGTVRSRIHYAKRALRSFLRKEPV